MVSQKNVLRGILIASIVLSGCVHHHKNITSELTSEINPSRNQKVMFINVDRYVNLEVIDFGGKGRGLILLSGLSDTAHRFSHFAQKLAKKFHVYGITRRGSGKSNSPDPAPENYGSDRLGGDVIAVIEALHLEKPIIVGHSFGGSEFELNQHTSCRKSCRTGIFRCTWSSCFLRRGKSRYMDGADRGEEKYRTSSAAASTGGLCRASSRRCAAKGTTNPR